VICHIFSTKKAGEADLQSVDARNVIATRRPVSVAHGIKMRVLTAGMTYDLKGKGAVSIFLGGPCRFGPAWVSEV